MESTLNRGSISVSVHIISRIPAISSLFRKRRRSFKYDEDATVFVRKTDGFPDGSLCRLSVINRSIPVILRTIDDENWESMEIDTSMSNVYLSPCLAAALGLHWFHLRHKRSTTAIVEILSGSCVVEASRATVKEIGLLPPTPCFSSAFGTNDHSDKQQEVEDDSGLRQFFMHQKKRTDKNSKSKPRQRLLALGSIFATTGDDGNSNHVRFYKVVEIQSSLQKGNEASNPNGAYCVSPSTHLTLLSQSLDDDKNGLIDRLPRPKMVAAYLSSIQDAKNCLTNASSQMILFDSKNCNPDETTSNSNSVQIIRHPSTSQVTEALYLLGVSSSTNKTCSICRKSHITSLPIHPQLIHVIGEEENHVSECVAEAADIVGMRYFRVEGLATFWAHYNFLHSYCQKSDEKVHRTLTGQLADKLQGLAAALKIAQKSAPCILHVVGIDEELSPAFGHNADADGRKEEEQRILQVIHEALLESSKRRHKMDPSHFVGSNEQHLDDAGNSSIAPQIAVVFSSAKPLPSGPLVSSLEQNSIRLSAPDLCYARYLWGENVDDTFDGIAPMLGGLSARDIVFLRRKFESRWKTETQNGSQAGNEKSTALAVSILKSLLSDLEKTHALVQASSYASGSSTVPLSSTALPNVRWEDIGGLSSVRNEIMDAVELPLKYPELFKGSRRSGILLFGPPGTGKTLVAKAVARECGLPFLSIKGPELLGSYVGESEANIRAVFGAARSAAVSAAKPHALDSHSGFESGQRYGGASVLFFDELDSLAPRRGETGHGDGVMERVVATLLGELDSGMEGGDNTADSSNSNSPAPHVIVIGATNRPDLLDPSLLRPGRFDRLLYLGPAKTQEACLQILLAQTRKLKFQDGIDRSEVLSEAMKSFPPTLSGADLSAVASGALMRALKRVCDLVEEEARRINSINGADGKSVDAVDINDVMESWTDEQLQPTVLVEDFVHAAKDIVPSIGEDDLKRFEMLRDQFSVAW